MRKVIDKYVEQEIKELLSYSPQLMSELGITSVNMSTVKFNNITLRKSKSEDSIFLFDGLYDIYSKNRNRTVDGSIDINGVTFDNLDKACENVIKVLLGAHLTRNNEWLSTFIYEYTMEFAKQSSDKCITFPIIPKVYIRDKSNKTRMFLIRLNAVVSKMLDDAEVYYNIGDMSKLKPKKSTTKSKAKSKPKTAMEKLNESNK